MEELLNLGSFISFLSTELKKMLELSYNIRHPREFLDLYSFGLFSLFETLGFFPNRGVNDVSLTFSVVPLKTTLNYEVLEKGHVRFWVQAKKLSSAASYRFIVNDKEVTAGEVWHHGLSSCVCNVFVETLDICSFPVM